tara:strand:- start:105 stop:776 length:672 start_codon:yes stop_codon:yes gene_type:complete
MAVTLRLRGVDGKFIKGNTENLQGAMIKFASKVIEEGRVILNKPGVDGHNKRTGSDTLYNQYHYTLKTSKNNLTIGFEFGSARDYWKFVDEGVRGVGYADAKSDGGKKGKRGRTGIARGQGSPFAFKYANPGGAMVNAIRGWINNKPISLRGSNENSAAWAIGYSIKRRGLERTQFYTIPVRKNLITLPDEVKEAFRIDIENLMTKLPSKMTIDSNKVLITTK